MNIYKDMIAIPPGETIKDELEYLNMTQKKFSLRMGLAEKTISQLINGEASLSYDTALKLETVLGIPASTWNSLEAQYREILSRIEEEKTIEKEWEICKKLPYKAMISRKWIDTTDLKNHSEIIKQTKNFFGVASLNLISAVEDKTFEYYEKTNTFFRKESNKKVCEYSMATWIRKGEVEASTIETKPYSRENILKIIPRMKELSLVNSHESIERLKELCFENGIALILLEHLPKTFVNGVSKWISKDKAMIILSNRRKKIDAFWFNFFHELSHLLNHKKKELFINADETNNFKIEEEANNYAREILISKSEYKKINKSKITTNYLKKLGEELKIHPSIILGILQYEKIVPYQTNLAILKENIIL